MRTVLPADKIAHLWIHKAQDNARTPTGNFSFCGATLKSYSTPIGYILPDVYGSAVIVSTASYSNTTNKHQYSMGYAIPSYYRHIYVSSGFSDNELRVIDRHGTDDIRALRFAEMRDCIMKAAKPRIRDNTRKMYIVNAGAALSDIQFLAGIDAKRKDITNEDRAKARAMLRRLPSEDALSKARDDKTEAVELAKAYARDVAAESMQSALAYIVRRIESFNQCLEHIQLRAEALAANGDSWWRQRTPASNARQHIYEIEQQLKLAREHGKIAGKRVPAKLAKQVAEIVARAEEMDKLAALEARDELLKTWQDVSAELTSARDEGRLSSGFTADSWIIQRIKRTANELATLDTEEQKAERARFIADIEKARQIELQRTAVERFNVAGIAFSNAIRATHWGTARDALRRMQDVISDANETDKPALESRLASMRCEYDNATKAERERVVAAWYAGSISQRLPDIAQYDDGTARLRVVGDTIQTSYGADVPLSVAPVLWRIVRNARNNQKALAYPHGEGPRLGFYRLDEVTEKGDIKAGCHRIGFNELARIASVISGTHAGMLESEGAQA